MKPGRLVLVFAVVLFYLGARLVLQALDIDIPGV
jgi:hypothetical protein